MHIAFDIVRVNAEKTEAIEFQQFLSISVAPSLLLVVVDTSIDLNCQAQFRAVEIDHEAPHWVLPAKSSAHEPTISEESPEDVFGSRLFRPKAPRCRVAAAAAG